MNRISPRPHLVTAAILVALAGASVPGAAQPPADPDGGSGTLTCEVYCSETKLRTGNARVSWIGPGMFEGAALGAAEPVAELLQTTVFKNGFDKNLFASFATLGGGEAMSTDFAEALPTPEMRAYDLAILEVARPTASPGLLEVGVEDPAARTSVDVEGLEPGMRYTWRIVIETADGQEISETVTCEAPVCPADILEEPVP